MFFNSHTKRRIFGILLLASLFSSHLGHTEIPSEVEADYSEAVLAFNSKNYDRALALLNEVFKKIPDNIELMELKALILKNTNNPTESAQLYQKLIDKKKKDNRPEKELAPYSFELAMIHYREKKTGQAQSEFELALDNDFNGPVCHLYLGMIAFQKGDFSKSETHFNGALKGKASEILPVVYFYLAQSNVKTGYPQGATHNLIMARDSSKSILDDPNIRPESKKLAEQIYQGTEKALAPFDRGQKFANLMALSGYDTNVMFLPSTIATPSEIIQKSAAKTMLMWSGGYASSPLKTWQWVPSLRGSINRNFSDAARGAEFVTNTASMYVNRAPMTRTNLGAKVDFTLLFKNTYATATPKTKYTLYNHNISVGPYLRQETFRKVLVGFELYFQPQKFYQDGIGDEIRTGNDYLARVFVQNDGGRRFFNPFVFVRYDLNKTNGKNYRSVTQGVTASNLLHLTQKMDVNLTADYSIIKFAERSPAVRQDDLLVLSAGGTYKFTPNWSTLLTADWTQNKSTEASAYSYDRTTAQVGVNYTF